MYSYRLLTEEEVCCHINIPITSQIGSNTFFLAESKFHKLMVKNNVKCLLYELPVHHQERVALLCLVAVVVAVMIAVVAADDIYK